jgi:hypothetical protein
MDAEVKSLESEARIIRQKNVPNFGRKDDPAGDPPQSESLGQQTIGGVTAQGTRSTMTIPAGQMGNELPIQVVSERWFSPELSMVVMTKNSDPRFGTTVYQLNNIRRDAPAASLFEVPPDYTVQDAPGPGNFFQQRIVK